MPPPSFLRAQPDGVWLLVKLQPRASQNEIGGPLGDELKIKVTAPPVDAAANQALIELLAEKLDCPRGKVELVRGQTSRHKTIKLHGFTPEEVLQKILQDRRRACLHFSTVHFSDIPDLKAEASQPMTRNSK